MENDNKMIQEVFFDLGIQHQANAVRLLSPDSVVLASSIPDEIGVKLNRQESSCQMCHDQESGQSSLTEVRTLAKSSNGIILVANRIENRIPCQECHHEDRQSLGVILVEFPAEQIGSRRLSFDNGLLIGSLLISILITGGIYIPITKKFIQPLKSVAKPINQDEFHAGENDIQRITHRVEKMEAELGQWEKTLADQHRKIDTIFSFKFDIENPPSLEKFFRQSISIVQEITGYETITIRLYEPRTEIFRIMAQTGMSPAMLNELKAIPADAGFHREVALTRLPVFTSDMANDPRMTSDAPIKQGYQSLICIPLLAHDNLVGTMQIALKYMHPWGEDEVRWLALIGRRIGLSIHQIQLTERLQDLAVLEERSRIAQEIHDGLAQLIGSLRLWSDEALISLEENNTAAAQKTLQKIENAAREAYASLRDEMLGLRDSIFPSKDLLKVITEYLNRFQRQWGIQTQLQLNGFANYHQVGPISPAAEVQLLRIIQEGMTNVRRHANASIISLSLSSSQDRLNVKIEDNGIGFDLEDIPENRLGLRIMRERAASVGGIIKIASIEGKGTQLEINIPLRTSENIQRGEG